VIDVAPTVLDVVGLPQPTQVNGVTQNPWRASAWRTASTTPARGGRHETQHFEIFGNRGIYHRGWSAETKHRTPWQTVGDVGIAFDDDIWALYDTSNDWTQARDLSRDHPGTPHELQRLFVIEATRYNVLPLDDRSSERVLPRSAASPSSSPGTSSCCSPAWVA
jgi:arylsulfatase A-like enzyme